MKSLFYSKANTIIEDSDSNEQQDSDESSCEKYQLQTKPQIPNQNFIGFEKKDNQEYEDHLIHCDDAVEDPIPEKDQKDKLQFDLYKSMDNKENDYKDNDESMTEMALLNQLQISKNNDDDIDVNPTIEHNERTIINQQLDQTQRPISGRNDSAVVPEELVDLEQNNSQIVEISTKKEKEIEMEQVKMYQPKKSLFKVAKKQNTNKVGFVISPEQQKNNESKKPENKKKFIRRMSTAQIKDIPMEPKEKIKFMQQQKIEILEAGLDKKIVYTSNNVERTAEENKKQYIDKYATKFEIPSYYTMDSQIYSSDPQYIVSVLNMKLPKNFQDNVTSHVEDGSIQSWDADIHYQNLTPFSTLYLYKQQSGAIISQDTFVFKGCLSSYIKFSHDSSLFAYCLKETNQIQIIKVDQGISELIKQIK